MSLEDKTEKEISKAGIILGAVGFVGGKILTAYLAEKGILYEIPIIGDIAETSPIAAVAIGGGVGCAIFYKIGSSIFSRRSK